MKERMNILASNDVITQESYEAILSVIDYFNSHWGLSESNEQYQMIMTHLARAADRIKEGNAIKEGLDIDTLEDIKSMPHFSEINEVNDFICSLMKLENVPEEENSFFLFNIASLYEMRG